MKTQEQNISVDERSKVRKPPEPMDEEASMDSDSEEAREAKAAHEERVPSADAGTSYLPEQTSAQASERWQRIQGEFVDDPRKSVAEAHQLVSELMQRIVDAFAKERGELERQWSEGDSVSTEDLRVCLQRYRAFFSRLLPSVNGLDSR
jgi:hypothetical protein